MSGTPSNRLRWVITAPPPSASRSPRMSRFHPTAGNRVQSSPGGIGRPHSLVLRFPSVTTSVRRPLEGWGGDLRSGRVRSRERSPGIRSTFPPASLLGSWRGHSGCPREEAGRAPGPRTGAKGEVRPVAGGGCADLRWGSRPPGTVGGGVAQTDGPDPVPAVRSDPCSTRRIHPSIE